MPKYQALALTTKFWKPNEDYLNEIITSVKTKVHDDDFVVVSEKALSTALGRIVDESKVKPSLDAKILSGFWMRIVWGYFLGVTCRFGQRLILRLRQLPG